MTIAFAAFLVLTFDRRYAVSPQRLSRRGILAFRWRHPQTFGFAFVTLFHLSFILAQIFWGFFGFRQSRVNWKKRFSHQSSDSFYEHYVTNALTFLLSKLVHFNLSNFQALFQLLATVDRYGIIPPTADVYRARKRDRLRYSHKFIFGNTAVFCHKGYTVIKWKVFIFIQHLAVWTLSLELSFWSMEPWTRFRLDGGRSYDWHFNAQPWTFSLQHGTLSFPIMSYT